MNSNSIAPATSVAFLLLLAPDTFSQCMEHRVGAPDASGYDYFGYSVDVDGPHMIVGAPGHDRGAVNAAGAAYVFDFGPNGWELDDEIDLSNGQTNDNFGAAVAIEGDLALISSTNRDFGGPSNAGVVYVYERALHAWTQTGALSPSDASHNDYFGNRVHLNGNRAIVSSQRSGPATAWVFEKQGGAWQEVAVLQVGVTTSYVGAVAIEGSTAVIGTPEYDGGHLHKGAVFVFEEAGGVWSQIAMLQPASDQFFEEFGRSVALEGDRMIVGCPSRYPVLGYWPGSAFAFQRNAGIWSLQAEMLGSSVENGFRFGDAVALEGEYALIGAPHAGPPTETGRAYLFHQSAGAWAEVSRLDPPEGHGYQRYGQAVALSGHVAAIARPYYNDLVSNAGEVNTFGIGSAANRCTSVANSTGMPATIDFQGSVSVITNNLRLVAADLPPNQFGIFYYGVQPVQIPFGDGYRCVGGQIFRFPPQSTQQGGATRLLDLTQPPGEAGRIQPGSTWQFQFWFRDPAAGGSGWNLTDALELIFCL